MILSILNIRRSADMARCPKCGKEVSKPERTFENNFFNLASYGCDGCKIHFQISNII